MEYAAKIINTRKLSSRGSNPDLTRSGLCRIHAFILGFFQKARYVNFKKYMLVIFNFNRKTTTDSMEAIAVHFLENHLRLQRL